MALSGIPVGNGRGRIWVLGRAGASGAGDPGKREVGARAAYLIRQVCDVCADGTPNRGSDARVWWSDGGSNPGPSACHADALPTELSPRVPAPILLGSIAMSAAPLNWPHTRLRT